MIPRTSITAVLPFGRTTASRPGALRATLTALLHSLPQENLIVVASGRPDANMREELHACQDAFPNVQRFDSAVHGVATARNIGIGESRTEYVLLCDADTIVPPGTLDAAASHAGRNTFVTGARREHVPWAAQAEFIQQAVASRDWAELDAIVAAPGSKKMRNSQSRQGNPDPVRERTFVGAFGLVTKEMLTLVCGFDTRFVAWGLEDVDLMRRLIRHYGCRNLQHHVTYHLDHLVEPHRREMHWSDNWNHYTSRCIDWGLLLVDHFFEAETLAPNDERVYLPPRTPEAAETFSLPESLDPAIQTELLAFAQERLSDPDSCAVLLHGSARYKREPADLDMVTLVYPVGFREHHRHEGAVTIEELKLSLVDLESSVDHPGRDPNSWPYVLERYDPAGIVGARLELRAWLRRVQQSALDRYWYHLLTYHAGNLHLELSRSGWALTQFASRHLAVLVGLAEGELPNSVRYPHFGAESRIAVMAECRERIESDRRVGLLDVLESLRRDIDARYATGFPRCRLEYPACLRGEALLYDDGDAV